MRESYPSPPGIRRAVPGTRPGAGTRATRRHPLRVEGLESRRPLAGAVNEFPVPEPNTFLQPITAGSDGDLYFIESGGRIDQFNPKTHAFSNIPVPGPALFIPGITAGPDGNVWFTGDPLVMANQPATNGFIGRYDATTHAVEEFPLSDPGSIPGRITAGPDGNLYFIERRATPTAITTAIGRINPDTHVINDFPIPDPAAFPSHDYDLTYDDITKGPDGNLWFAGQAHLFTTTIFARFPGFAGTFNPTTHASTAFTLPNFQTAFVSITTGPDGNVWYTDSESPLVGRINPGTQAVATFPTPNNASPGAITTGADDNLYFAESLYNQATVTNDGLIGRINPTTHVFADVPLPSGHVPAGITGGPDGNVWFTDSTQSGQSAIGQFLIRGSSTVLTATPGAPTVGQSVTFTAAVSPAVGGSTTGTVTFLIDGRAQPPVPLVAAGGQEQATFTTSSLGAGSHQVSAVYSGDAAFDASTSNTVTQAVADAPPPVIAPPAVDGPTVVRLQRFGVRRQPTQLLLTFNSRLDPARARFLGNYRLVGPDGHPIRITRAVYDPVTRTVDLHPSRRLNLQVTYRLTVKGTGPLGLADRSGHLLDGRHRGKPGGNFVGFVDAHSLVPVGRRAAVGTGSGEEVS